MTRGYFGIGIYQTKTEANVGTLWRSANLFGASFIFTIGRRYRAQSSDTMQTPRHVPLTHYEDFADFYAHLPHSCRLIGVEQDPPYSQSLPGFSHPERCVYLLGAEDNGLPRSILDKCHGLVEVPTPRCLNVAVAGSIVMYDRAVKPSSP